MRRVLGYFKYWVTLVSRLSAISSRRMEGRQLKKHQSNAVDDLKDSQFNQTCTKYLSIVAGYFLQHNQK